ncbi:hypothetical protein DFH08DRAFT_861364 [Mycena albidolilacea]|uniref:Uncharacterized protein n=1 Tax=Mycena albidolilacea TaxID=1033008 RepID=A0AAD7A691_9AGAR|nr:hypothetical protein DFH08DRAFT_861364 [Mycena albidolilacea]
MRRILRASCVNVSTGHFLGALGEGDGTVSLVNLGAMCVERWTRKRCPAGIKITTVEVRV